MTNLKLNLYSQEDIIKNEGLLKHKNAFILPDGTFYLAKGYTFGNPSHQLESSSLDIIRKEIGFNIPKTECEEYFQNLGVNYSNKSHVNNTSEKKYLLYYLRSILVHYYGYALFARREFESHWGDGKLYSDESMIPDPYYFGNDATEDQIEILKKLFELNTDRSWELAYGRDRFKHSFDKDVGAYIKSLSGHYKNYWHREDKFFE